MKAKFEASRLSDNIGDTDFCQKNRPTWEERPFLQKITDVLTAGIKILIRNSISKEENLTETLGKTITNNYKEKLSQTKNSEPKVESESESQFKLSK